MNDFLIKNSDIDTMFENCFTMPPYSRVEFLSLTQRKSGFSTKTFLNLLLTRWKDYREQVFSEYLSMGYEEVNKIYGFEFCLKIWGDEPEDFEFYDYTNKDNEAILDYSCCENESTLSSFTKNEQTEVAWLNEDILFLIREYIYKLYEFYTDTIKPIETSKIINMKNELFDDLHIYSNYIYNIPLESITIEKIIYLSSELFQDEFIDAKSYLFQNALLNTKESAINFVLANLNEAISTKCGNNIDFENLSDNNFNFNYTEIPGETSIKKKYSNIKYQPADFEQFKKIWLFRLIEEIKEVRNTICTILQKPIIDQKQNSDIPNKNDYDFKIDTILLREIHSICDDDIFDCSEIDFYQYVKSANFSALTILKKTKVLRMIYYLSKVMHRDWYQVAANSISATKNICSSASVDDLDYWRIKIEKIDSRFSKKIKI